MKRVSIATLGCKVNQFETAGLEKAFQDRGFKLVSLDEEADICIVNTCTVTSKTDRQSRQIIRRLRRRNPTAFTIVTGCYAEVARREIEEMDGVDLIVENRGKAKIPELVDSIPPQGGEKPGSIKDVDVESWMDWPELVPAPMGHTRALLKVQDGCDLFCTYCIVPYARGKNRSLPLKKVLTRVRGLAEKGYQEVVLTGINLGRYGVDLHPEMELLHLLEEIEKEKGPPRIRLSSIEPMELNRPLISFIAGSKKICHHLHIPLQSGEDEILKRMGRPYSSDDFAEVIRAAYDKIKDLTIGIDVIAGFPGEENHNFENTYRFIESLPFTYLHVFPFSPRKGTPAAKLKDHVPSPTIKERTSRLRLLGNKRRERICLENLGKTHKVLVEGERGSGFLQGLTANYLRIYFKGKRELINRIIPVTLTTLENGRLHGVPHE